MELPWKEVNRFLDKEINVYLLLNKQVKNNSEIKRDKGRTDNINSNLINIL